jgi:hypothetical protein
MRAGRATRDMEIGGMVSLVWSIFANTDLLYLLFAEEDDIVTL